MGSRIISIALLLSFFLQGNSLQLTSEEGYIRLTFLDDGSIAMIAVLGDEEKMSGLLGIGRTLKLTEDCTPTGKCLLESDDDSTITISNIDSGYHISWTTSNPEAVFQDCLDLKSGELNWFGGPEKWQQDWPVETQVFENRPYISLKSDNGAVSERYWLNSKGGFIFIQDEVPLFLDQNNLRNDSICFIAKLESPYVGRSTITFEYDLITKVNAREAQLHAVNNFLGKASEHPDEWMIRHPIWTTWAKYKKDINDEIVLGFAQDIADHGFGGQIEIDEQWENCFGELTFGDKFTNINDTVQAIKDLGFTVTLWSHPFINENCEEILTYAREQNYLVNSIDGGDETSWWEGTAHYIDFTNEDARNWWSSRIQLLQDMHGIDSFKFDAGESDYPPPNPVLSSSEVELSPGLITKTYVNTCATFGKSIEVRSGWRTQNLPIFVRMLDKDSRWTINNGLHSLITTLLQFNIVGYSFVLPDMIGGNGYTEQPSAELIARWTQANTFMPAMQFSYLPWDITSDEFDGTEIVKKFVDLHDEYTDEILIAMNNSIVTGAPVNPPIWWIDPTNSDALKVNDEYLLGEKILVAPVIQEGAVSRDIVLPNGTWVDGNDGTIYEGPQILTNYPAPIDVLPFFIRQ